MCAQCFHHTKILLGHAALSHATCACSSGVGTEAERHTNMALLWATLPCGALGELWISAALSS